jgi:acyl dehydratase
MAIDPDKLCALAFPEIRQRYTLRDSIVYALGVGFGLDPSNESELRFVDEAQLVAAPTMANILAHQGFWIRDLETGIAWVKVVHGEQAMQLHRPLTPEGDVVGRTRVVEVVDKGLGNGALVYVEREISDAATGAPIATLLQTVFCRGDGGFGGNPTTWRKPHPVPARAPDISLELPTHRQMALIYRLSGDPNPLHISPAVARKAGYERPILHGLATYGVAGHALLKALCGYDATRFRSIEARFSAPVFPGETITTDIWRESDGIAAFGCRVAARNTTVIANGFFTYDNHRL